MAQIIQDMGLGEKLGTGLGEGLKQLATNRLNTIQRQQAVQQGAQFWKSLNLPDQLAYGLANQDPSIQKGFLDRLQGLNIPQGGQQQQFSQQQPIEGLSPEMAAKRNELMQARQQPQQVGAQNSTQTGGLSIGPNSADRRAAAALAQSAQHHIENQNAPVIAKIKEKAVIPREVQKLAQDALDIL